MKKNLQLSLIVFLCILVHFTYCDFETNSQLFENKSILILGGTGYLGRAIAKEVLKYNPASITIFSRDEVKHFNIAREFGSELRLRSALGDIRDYERLLHATAGIDIVFHVAALKRMDMLESFVDEAIKTDILGSLNVFNACCANHVQKVLFVSTDKACSPINTYGACKFVSEKIFTNYDKNKTTTKFMVVRFGNILDSTGSVIPIFIDKIKNGQEITLTDPLMTRFIIDKKEATELMFDALRYGSGGEIFVKRLPSMKITDLIDVLKNKFKASNKVTIVGLRPGEKINEVLINESEMKRTYVFGDCFVITPSIWQSFANDKALPEYIKQGIHQEGQFSSDQVILAQHDLSELFKAVNLF